MLGIRYNNRIIKAFEILPLSVLSRVSVYVWHVYQGCLAPLSHSSVWHRANLRWRKLENIPWPADFSSESSDLVPREFE